jgi:hypothetical protein
VTGVQTCALPILPDHNLGLIAKYVFSGASDT